MVMLEMFHPSGQELADAVLVTSELFTNAVATSSGGEIEVVVKVPEREVKISVTNIGPEFGLPTVFADSAASDPRTFGLRIAQMLGHVEVTRVNDATTVVVILPLREPNGPPQRS